MTVYNIDHLPFEEQEKMLILYDDYNKVNDLINEMKLLKSHLKDNNIIKQSKNYIVLSNDSFSYTSSTKLGKIFLKDYITNETQELFKYIFIKYNIFKINIFDGNELMINKCYNKSFVDIEILSTFRFDLLNEFKQIIKILIKKGLN